MYQLLIVFIIFISTLFAIETELKKTSIFIECHFCNEDFNKWQRAPHSWGFLFVGGWVDLVLIRVKV